MAHQRPLVRQTMNTRPLLHAQLFSLRQGFTVSVLVDCARDTNLLDITHLLHLSILGNLFETITFHLINAAH